MVINLTPEDVAKHLKEGRTQGWICQKYDVGPQAVRTRKNKAIELGLWSDSDRVTIGKMAVGHLNKSLARLEPEIQRWIIANTTGDMTIADFVVACAVDAYLEEKDAT